MIITIDANILVALLNDKAFAYGFKQFCHLNKVEETLIPAPAMCEFLAHDYAERFSFFQKFKRQSRIISFDEKAAYLTAQLGERYNKNKLDIGKQKVKVDLQILGIALANHSLFILTKDGDFNKYIERLKLKIGIKTVADLYIKDDLFGEK